MSVCPQPTVTPASLFFSSNHFSRGSKYSRMALVLISGCPVIFIIASFHGRLAPSTSISFNLSPASTLP